MAHMTPTSPACPMENTMENTFYLGKSHSSSNHFYSYEYPGRPGSPTSVSPAGNAPNPCDTCVLLCQ